MLSLTAVMAAIHIADTTAMFPTSCTIYAETRIPQPSPTVLPPSSSSPSLFSRRHHNLPPLKSPPAGAERSLRHRRRACDHPYSRWHGCRAFRVRGVQGVQAPPGDGRAQRVCRLRQASRDGSGVEGRTMPRAGGGGQGEES